MNKQIIEMCKAQRTFEPAALLAFISVETGGQGFDSKTGKLVIQFEPAWFRKKAPFAPSGVWSVNKVDVQAKEWLAFNNAFKLNAEAAMESTSIGLGQIMGFHYKRLGYTSVGAMWDDAKKGLIEQLNQMMRFIDTDSNLKRALIDHHWHTVASIYNGKHYKELALKIGREPYNITLEKAYNKYLKTL